MPFSHHSHSGQFCPGHARNTLEEMVLTAISRGMQVFCLTEHMPRERVDFYPEEIESNSTENDLVKLIDDFYYEAMRLRAKYASQVHILIGFEAEWIRPSSRRLVEELLKKHHFDLFVGSVHHMYTIPIDFDSAMYRQAREVAGGTDEQLFENYFDVQYDMLLALKPPVVGHFDLIRLYSDEPDQDMVVFNAVWGKILRNLKLVAEYGGLLELNSSALRKGLARQYPTTSICKAFSRLGGRFCLSDDSHGVEQVGLNYHRVLEDMHDSEITKLHYLRRGELAFDPRFPTTMVMEVETRSLEEHKLMVMA